MPDTLQMANQAHGRPGGCGTSHAEVLRWGEDDMSEPLPLTTSPTDTQALSEPLPCPLCGQALHRDPLWSSPHWLCVRGHSYSNVRVLLAELHARVVGQETGAGTTTQVPQPTTVPLPGPPRPAGTVP